MNRDDAEELARAYCLRTIQFAELWDVPTTRPQAERIVLAKAQARYGSGLTTAATRRIRRTLREARP
jgi:hypothetical protein